MLDASYGVALAVSVAVLATLAALARGKASAYVVVGGAKLDPRGGSALKNWFARAVCARVARRKEIAKVRSSNAREIEAFHRPEPHDFFNESHYYNGCDAATEDRFITRISRRGKGGKVSYVMLFVDSAEHGPLSLEADNVPVNLAVDHPEALGVSFVCEEPLRRWRVRYSGPMRRGCIHPQSREGRALKGGGSGEGGEEGSVHV